MEIVRVEPTPSPNTMKIVLSEKRKDNQSTTYTTVNDKQPKADWENVLPLITSTLNHEETFQLDQKPDEHYGEVHAEVLMFKGKPYQLKLTSNKEEKRKQLPEIYIDKMLETQKDNDNIIFIRKWQDFGIRYDELQDVMNDLYEEVLALYPKQRLENLVNEALTTDFVVPKQHFHHITLEKYSNTHDWKARLRMLKAFPTPAINDIPLLETALAEEKIPLRREAVVLLGMIESTDVFPYIYKGLHDQSPAVRRTAGDCISDLVFKEALPEMEKALADPQKIVRWRSAMFIFDEGNEKQLHSLKVHADDSAYGVKMQIEMAISRIENGDEALGSV